MSKFEGFMVFSLGFILGCAAASRYLSKKIERIEEERYSEKTEERNDYVQMIKKSGYNDYTQVAERNVEIISKDSFEENEDYELYGIVCYADGILVNENDEPVGMIGDISGTDILDEFTKRETDLIYVRNEDMSCDYEVIFDHRKYSEIQEEKTPEIGEQFDE